MKLYTNHELQVTATGHVEDEPGSRKLYQFLRDDYLAKMHQGTIPELRAELRNLKISTDGSAPGVTFMDEANGPQGQRRPLKFESEPGIELRATLYVPSAAGRKPAVLFVADSTRLMTSAATLAEWAAEQGRVVLEMEPRNSLADADYGPLVGQWLANSRADQIGLNLPAMRAHDILRGVDLLAARSDVDASSIHAFARGVDGVWLLLAATADPRIGKLWLDRTPYSLRLALENPVNTDLSDAVRRGFVLHRDLNDLVKAMGYRPVIWTDPTNWMRRVVSLTVPPYQYRYVLGDATDFSDAQDDAYLNQLPQQ